MDSAWAEGSFDYNGSAAELAVHVTQVLEEMGKINKVDQSKGVIKATLEKPSIMAGFSKLEAIIMSTADGARVDVTISSPVSYAKGADTQATLR